MYLHSEMVLIVELIKNKTSTKPQYIRFDYSLLSKIFQILNLIHLN